MSELCIFCNLSVSGRRHVVVCDVFVSSIISCVSLLTLANFFKQPLHTQRNQYRLRFMFLPMFNIFGPI